MRKRKYLSKGIKIEFNRTYLLMALTFVLTGYYLNLIVFTSLIIVHEFGHYLVARILKFRVDRIIIYPYGGITKINDLINRDICEELLIATSGVIFQYIFYILIVILYKNGLIREYTYSLYNIYNGQMIFFNLMPIYPLDGGQIMSLVFCKYFSYNKSILLTISISFLVIILVCSMNIYESNYSNLMTMIVLFTYLYKLYKNRRYLYNRFLLERYLYNIRFSRKKVIDSIDKMFKNRSHIICSNNSYIGEDKLLKRMFRGSNIGKYL